MGREVITPPEISQIPSTDPKTYGRRLPNTTTFTPKIGREICQQLMQQRTLREICESPRLPHLVTVQKWLADPRYKEFREEYYHARRIAAEMYVDEIFTIADDSSNDWTETFDRNGKPNGYKPDHDVINRARLKVDTRKWYAAKMIPKIYGDKQQVEHDVTGDLAELLRDSSNQTKGLPRPVIEHEK